MDANRKPEVARPYFGLCRGVLSQMLRRDLTFGGFREFLRQAAGRAPADSVGGLLVSVEGMKEGARVRMEAAQAEAQGAAERGMDMDEATGTPLAVMASMLLEGRIPARGVLAPEACIDPTEFSLRMERILPDFRGAMEIRTERL